MLFMFQHVTYINIYINIYIYYFKTQRTQMVVWMLKRQLLIQLHTYVLMVISPDRTADSLATEVSSIVLGQSAKKGVYKNHLESSSSQLLCGSSDLHSGIVLSYHETCLRF